LALFFSPFFLEDESDVLKDVVFLGTFVFLVHVPELDIFRAENGTFYLLYPV